MALFKVASFKETILELADADDGDMQRWNHVLEPEFHQDCYAGACLEAAGKLGSFQLSDLGIISRPLTRGVQPSYADDDEDEESLEYEGLVRRDGSVLDSNNGASNVCALKSVTVRAGYIDFGGARSVSRNFYEKRKERAGVQNNDVLINSTGDGTIGRVAVFNKLFPALVDGHITIVRFRDPDIAWYAAAYLMSEQGQNQLYRYINGSSGQVEIYPQDIGRVWIPRPDANKITKIANQLRSACKKHEEFASEMRLALSMVE